MRRNVTPERVREIYEASRRPVKYDFVRILREECGTLTIYEASNLFELLKQGGGDPMIEVFLRNGGP